MPPVVVAVIPVLDEQDAIGRVLSEMPGMVSRRIVVDNGSRDRSADVARSHGAWVLHEPRRGYGQACLTGIAAAPDADVFVFLDGDYSDHPAQVVDVVAPILAGQADLVVGSRRLGRSQPGAQPWHARAGTRACVTLMNLLAGTRATDLGPFRAIAAPALRRLEMRELTFGWTAEMQVKAARRGLLTAEVPVDYRPRIGVSKISGTLSGSVRAGAGILGTIARYSFGT